MDDWNKISVKEVIRRGGSGLLHQYNGSLVAALQTNYPEHNWETLEKNVPIGSSSADFWEHPDCYRNFLDKMYVKYNLESIEAWKGVSTRAVVKEGGVKLLEKFGNLHNALRGVYDEIDWEFLNARIGIEFWYDRDNLLEFFERVFIKLKLSSIEDWGTLSSKFIRDYGGNEILRIHNGSHFNALQIAFPDYEWKILKLKFIPTKFWNERRNIIQFFQEVEELFQIQKPEDWYKYTYDDLANLQGSGLLKLYDTSLADALNNIYSDDKKFHWDVFKFPKLPPTFFDFKENHKRFMDHLYEKLKFKSLDSWKTSNLREFKNLGGNTLLKYYEGNFQRALISIYPDHNWGFDESVTPPHLKQENIEKEKPIHDKNNMNEDPSKSHHDIHHDPPKGLHPYEVTNIKKFVNRIQKSFNINKRDDWYKITSENLYEQNGHFLAKKYGHILQLLSYINPEIDWVSNSPEKLKRNFENSHHVDVHKSWLLITLGNILISQNIMEKNEDLNEIIIRNYSPTNETKSHHQEVLTHVDLFIPRLNLAFDYIPFKKTAVNNNITSIVTPSKFYNEKKKYLKEKHSIDFIGIPYWWDKSRETLQSTIAYHFPDKKIVKDKMAFPISLIPPAKEYTFNRDTFAYFQKYIQNQSSIENENLICKLKGLRVFWDGSNLYQADGSTITIPTHCFESLPSGIILDGEFYSADGSLESVQKAIENHACAESWSRIYFRIFDTPTLHTLPFAERLQILKEIPFDGHFSVAEFDEFDGSHGSLLEYLHNDIDTPFFLRRSDTLLSQEKTTPFFTSCDRYLN